MYSNVSFQNEIKGRYMLKLLIQRQDTIFDARCSICERGRKCRIRRHLKRRYCPSSDHKRLLNDQVSEGRERSVLRVKSLAASLELFHPRHVIPYEVFSPMSEQEQSGEDADASRRSSQQRSKAYTKKREIRYGSL